MKKHLKKIQELLKNKDVIHFAVCSLILLIILALRFLFHNQLMEYIDLEMLTSVVLAFFLTTLATIIARAFTNAFEDSTKLTNDYDTLIKIYKENTEMLFCQNRADANNKLGRKSSCKGNLNDQVGDSYEIPVADVILFRGKQVVVHDFPQEKYTLPEFCQKHYSELLNAHDFSKTYNQTIIRADDIKQNGGEIHISFSRSTYFDSLVANRAIDFKINGVCVRDVYAHGPYLAPLKDSKLSNHIGFNGMVETSDGKFVFIKRHGKVSIGKNTMQCSVAASLKAKYAINKNGEVTKDGIEYAMKREIEDELSLDRVSDYAQRREDIFNGFSFDKNVLYFYRDLVEGGKPQFMFYAKINITSNELKNAQPKKKRKLSLIQDGYRMFFVDKEGLERMYLSPDTMILNDRRYPAMPSAVGTVVMLKQAMAQGLIRENIEESFTLSKKGARKNNEDALYVGDRFIAVIDGATAKTEPPPNATISSGRFAAQSICRQLENMPSITEPIDIIKALNDKLKEDVNNSVFAKCEEKPTASIVLYDSFTRQIISYGDCQALIKGRVYKREKRADIKLAKKRALILKDKLESGFSIEELLKNDVGRKAIVEELLAYSKQYANKKEGDGFPVLGVGEIIEDYIDTYPLDVGESVVLASDGYPVLKENLMQSENTLFEITTKDPLLIHQYKSTKGITQDNESYDDRTYIRFEVK